MWTEGSIIAEDGSGTVRYCLKHYEEPSEWGIDGGRISKLELRQDGAIVANYDRGWDIKPQTAAAECVLEILTEQYN